MATGLHMANNKLGMRASLNIKERDWRMSVRGQGTREVESRSPFQTVIDWTLCAVLIA